LFIFLPNAFWAYFLANLPILGLFLQNNVASSLFLKWKGSFCCREI